MSYIDNLSPVKDDTATYRSSSGPRSRRNSLDISSETHASRTRSGITQLKLDTTPVTQKEFSVFELKVRSLTTRITDLERKNLKINPSVVDSTWQEILKIRAFVGYTENSPSRRTRSSYDDLQYTQRTPSPTTLRITSQSNRFFPRGGQSANAEEIVSTADDEVYAALSPMLDSPISAFDKETGTRSGGGNQPQQQQTIPQQSPVSQVEIMKLVAIEVAQQMRSLRDPSSSYHHLHLGDNKPGQVCPIFTEKEEIRRCAISQEEISERLQIQQNLINSCISFYNRLNKGYQRHLDELHDPEDSSHPRSNTRRDFTPERMSNRRHHNPDDLLSPPENRRNNNMASSSSTDEDEMRYTSRTRSGGGNPPPRSSSMRKSSSVHHQYISRSGRSTSNLSQASGAAGSFQNQASSDRIRFEASDVVNAICNDTALLHRISTSSIEKGAWSSALHASLKPPSDDGLSQWQVETDEGGSPPSTSGKPEWLRLIQEKSREEADKAIAGAEKYLQDVACPSVVSSAMKEAVLKLEDQLGERFESRMRLLESAVDGHKRGADIVQTAHEESVNSIVQDAKRDIEYMVDSVRTSLANTERDIMADKRSGLNEPPLPPSPPQQQPQPHHSNKSLIDHLMSDTTGDVAPRSLTEFVLLRPITAFEIDRFISSSSNSPVMVVRRAISFLGNLKARGANLLDFLNGIQLIDNPLYASIPSTRLDFGALLEGLRSYLLPSPEDGTLLTWQQHLNHILNCAKHHHRGQEGSDPSTTTDPSSPVDPSVTAARLFYHASQLSRSLLMMQPSSASPPSTSDPQPLTSAPQPPTSTPQHTFSTQPPSAPLPVPASATAATPPATGGRLLFDVDNERTVPSTNNKGELLPNTLNNIVQDLIKLQNRSPSGSSYRSDQMSSTQAPPFVPRSDHNNLQRSSPRSGYPHLAPTVPLNEVTSFRHSHSNLPPHAHVKGVFSPSNKPRTPHSGHGDSLPSPTAKRPNFESIRTSSYCQPLPRSSSATDSTYAIDRKYTDSRHVVRSPSAQYTDIHTSRSSSVPVHKATTVVHHHYHPQESLEDSSTMESTPPRTKIDNFYDRDDSVSFNPLSTVSPSASRGMYSFNARSAEEEQRRSFMEKSRRATRNALAAARLYQKR